MWHKEEMNRAPELVVNSRWLWLARWRIRRHARAALKKRDGVVHAGFEIPHPDGKKRPCLVACTCSGAITKWAPEVVSDDIIRNEFLGDWARPFRNQMGVPARKG